MFYINFRNPYDGMKVETCDMFDNFKDAKNALREYNLEGSFHYYISERSTKEWRDSL